jgi:ABC-type polysaccharide/polyol phosphate export permease
MQFSSLLTVLFVALKLTGYIDWNWFLVLLPMLLVPIIFLILLFVAAVVGLKVKDVENSKKK